MTNRPTATADPGRAARAAAARLPDRIAFLGFGLIGGSIAMAIRATGSSARLAAWTPRGNGPSEGLRRGLVDEAAASPAQAIAAAGLVVLAGPPLEIVDLVATLGGDLRSFLDDDAAVTDVGSTKAQIGAAADAAGLHFVGGHPMAGREVSGVGGAKTDLFIERPWVVVPGRHARPIDVDRVEALAVTTGARPIRLGAEDHDAAVAAISHLPLLVSAALVRSVATPGATTWSLARQLAATGWADMTRLARGDPGMGAGIVATNRAAIRERLLALRDALQSWIDLLDDGADAAAIRTELARVREMLVEPERP